MQKNGMRKLFLNGHQMGFPESHIVQLTMKNMAEEAKNEQSSVTVLRFTIPAEYY